MGWKYEKKKQFLDWRDEKVATLKVWNSARKSKSIPRNFLIGPTNSAGQATGWIAALARSLGIPGDSMRILSGGPELFDADIKLDRKNWIGYKAREARGVEVVAKYSDIFLESLNPIVGLKSHNGFTSFDGVADLAKFKKYGKKVGAIFHGSDIRDVDFHIATNKYSPFKDGGADLEKLRTRSAQNRAAIPALKEAGIPYFVTTPDLLHDAPGAKWLPVVIDFAKFNSIAATHPVTTSNSKLRILYLPSSSWIKSANIIEPILDKLHKEGTIERIYTESVSNNEVPALIAKADVVIDQFVGVAGVLALEAMAAGRMVLTHIEEVFYKDQPLPPVTEVNPENLEQILRTLEIDPNQIQAGIAFVSKWHDGRVSAEVLANA